MLDCMTIYLPTVYRHWGALPLCICRALQCTCTFLLLPMCHDTRTSARNSRCSKFQRVCFQDIEVNDDCTKWGVPLLSIRDEQVTTETRQLVQGLAKKAIYRCMAHAIDDLNLMVDVFPDAGYCSPLFLWCCCGVPSLYGFEEAAKEVEDDNSRPNERDKNWRSIWFRCSSAT